MELNFDFDGKLADRISRITLGDRILFEQQLDETPSNKPGINYENSFEYIRMYFDLGKFQGYRYLDNDGLIFFSSTGSKKDPHFKVYKPLGQDSIDAVRTLTELVQALQETTTNPITITCLSNEHLKTLKKIMKIKKIKHFEYYIYDLRDLSDLKGTKWKNVRQKINTFSKNHPKVRIEDLDENNSKKALHFISTWRRAAAAKGFSYIDVDKNKAAVQFYQDKIDHKFLWAKVYYLRGRVEALQFLYKITTADKTEACAHAIGMANNDIAGLSEYTQIDIWQHVLDKSIRYVNDGPSWRPGLLRYKRKFNPCGVQQVNECVV